MTAISQIDPAHVGDLAPVVRYLQSILGARFDGNRGVHLLAAIREAVERADTANATAYLARMRQDPAARDDLLALATVGETYFFRHPEQLDILTQRLIPELLAQRRAVHRLTLWSAGCATGEEAYTLAMLAEDMGVSARVLGTDVSPDALRQAAAACYRPWSLRGEHGADRFEQVGDRIRVPRPVARRVELARLNLLHDSYPRDVDVILCRNVLMYLTVAAIRTVAERLAAALAPGGWLITAPADPDIECSGVLERVMTPAGVMYRRALQHVAPSATETPPVPSSPRRRCRQQVAAADPTPAQALEALARGDHAGAAGAAQAVVAGGGDSPVMRVAWARALGNGGDIVQAEQVAAAGVAAFPDDAELRRVHAELLLEGGQPDAAAAAGSAAVYLDPGLGAAYLVLGQAELARGRVEPARRAFGEARRLLQAAPATREAPADVMAGYAAAYEQMAARKLGRS